MNILIIEPQFEAEPDIERSVTGPDAVITVWRVSEQGPPPPEVLAACEILMTCRSQIHLTAEMIAHLDRCRVVVQSGVGFNHIDIAACARRGIPVCNTPDYGTSEVADHAMGLALALVRGIPVYDSKLKSRKMGWFARQIPTVRRLRGATFGIVGMGRIGTATALRARGFETEIAFYDPYLPAGTERAFGFRRANSLAELMGMSDIVSVHTPLTDETAGMIGEAALQAAKPRLYLVNTSRGGTMDLSAIEAALRDGRLAGAALDVLPTEPIDYAHPLLKAYEAEADWLEGRLIITPHAAFFSPDSIKDLRRIAMQTGVDYVRGGAARSCVNAHLLEAFAEAAQRQPA